VAPQTGDTVAFVNIPKYGDGVTHHDAKGLSKGSKSSLEFTDAFCRKRPLPR
jgi:hypothetical protein